MTIRAQYDVVIAGAGHNALVAAAVLARAGRSVLVLERNDEVGGAAVSERLFEGIDARLSRYSYLVSLMPRWLVDELGLPIELRRRRVSSYMPVGDKGLLVRNEDDPFYTRTGAMAAKVFPTLTEPLLSRAAFAERVGVRDWMDFFDTPLGEALEAAFPDDDVRRGVALTDALIGTFTYAHDPSLLQNRCFLYHVIGNGTGDWDVPVGGMGAVTTALCEAATAAGAEIVCGASVGAIDPASGEVHGTLAMGGGFATRGDKVLAGFAPHVLAAACGADPFELYGPPPEGAQLKVNMVLSRLPRLRDPEVAVEDAFAGTFHVNESYSQLQAAHEEASVGRIPSLPPCEIYCHSLTDPSILGEGLRAAGAHTLTLFGLHMPARLFHGVEHATAKTEAVRATLASLNSVLAEPIEDCLMLDQDGAPCLEAKTPVDLEREVRLPGGHIFHRDLAWPFAETAAEVGTWGVETPWRNVLLCGAGARRGGGVSGIPGWNAAQAVLAG